MAKLHRIPDETRLEVEQGVLLPAPTREYYNECDCMSDECFDCFGTQRSFRQRVISNVGLPQPPSVISDYFIALNKELTKIDNPIVIRIPCAFDSIAKGYSYTDYQLVQNNVACQRYGNLEVLTLLTCDLNDSSYSDFIGLLESKIAHCTLVGVFDWHGKLPQCESLRALVNPVIQKARTVLPWAHCTYLDDNYDLPLLPESYVPTNVLEVKALASSMSEQDDAQNVLAMYERAGGENYQERAIAYIKEQLLHNEFEDYPVFEITHFGSRLNFNIEAGGVSANVITYKSLPKSCVGSAQTKSSVALLVPEELSGYSQKTKRFTYV